MKISSAIVHDVNPGSSPVHLREGTQTLTLSNASIGIELDVTMKRLPGSRDRQDRQVPVAISRDGTARVELREHISTFIDKGFTGPYLLDVTNRRATTPILEQAGALGHDQLFISMPSMAIGYKTPWAHNSGLFKVEKFWRDSWDRLVVNSREPGFAREFISQGAALNLFWTPVEDDSYRQERLDLVRQAKVILYKMPHLTHSALFDPNACMERDLDFFNSVSNEMIVVPMGSIDLLREHRKCLFSDDSCDKLATDAGLKLAPPATIPLPPRRHAL